MHEKMSELKIYICMWDLITEFENIKKKKRKVHAWSVVADIKLVFRKIKNLPLFNKKSRSV
jgi:hypothetical protein